MPELLFLTQILPYPLNSGSKVRAYHILRWLANHFEVHLVSFVRSDDSPEAISHLASFLSSVHTIEMKRSRYQDGRHLLRSLLSNSSFIISRDRVDEMFKLIEALISRQNFVAVHADQLNMAQYAYHLPVDFRVLDMHNAVYQIFERLACQEKNWLKRLLLRREVKRLAEYEAQQAALFEAIIVECDEIRRSILRFSSDRQRRFMNERSYVIPISLDTERKQPVVVRPEAKRITILGTMYYPPNAEAVLWFAKEVFPEVLAVVPEAILTVIGKNPPDSFQRLAQRFNHNIEITGHVEKLEPYLAETAVFAIPLLSGSGMKVKLLDAWAWGLPIVSTTVGAEGIKVTPGQDVLIADDPTDFAKQVIKLFQSSDQRREIGRAGRKTVETFYDSKGVNQDLAKVYARFL